MRKQDKEEGKRKSDNVWRKNLGMSNGGGITQSLFGYRHACPSTDQLVKDNSCDTHGVKMHG